MRIIITESQFKRVLLTETKTVVVPDDKLNRAASLVNKLKSRGFTLSQASAMVGNMWIESGFDPTAKGGNGAIGLMQWLNEPRKQALLAFAKHLGTTWEDEETQLDFMKVELKNAYKLANGKIIAKDGDYEVGRFNDAMAGDTIRKKAENFATMVERCGDCEGSISNRKESAKKIHDYINGTYKPKETPSAEKKETKSSMIGKTIYPKKGGDGYVNVRGEAKRDSVMVTRIVRPNKVGTVTEIKTDDAGNKWYKVNLSKKVDNYTVGFVRSDMVE